MHPKWQPIQFIVHYFDQDPMRIGCRLGLILNVFLALEEDI